jgi:hypothetical protein
VPAAMRVNLTDECDPEIDRHVGDFVEERRLDDDEIGLLHDSATAKRDEVRNGRFAVAPPAEPKGNSFVPMRTVTRHLAERIDKGAFGNSPALDAREEAHRCRPWK